MALLVEKSKHNLSFPRRTFLGSIFSGLVSFNLFCSDGYKDYSQLKKKKLVCIKLNGGIDSLALFSSKDFDKFYQSHILGDKFRFSDRLFDCNFFNNVIRPCLDMGINFSLVNNAGFRLYNNSHFIASDLWELNVDGKGFFSNLNGINYSINGGNSFLYSDNQLTETDINQFKVFESLLSSKDLVEHFSFNQLQFLQNISSNPDFDELFDNSLLKSLNLGYSGFDTHSSQNYKIQKSITPFYDTLKYFFPFLKQSNLVLYLYSEFGRTIDWNASKGTDHGQAGLCIVLGGDNLLHSKLKMFQSELEEIEIIGVKRVLKPMISAESIRTTINEWLFL